MAMNKITIEDSHDYVALSWVKDEIVNTLSQVQTELTSLADNPQDTSILTSCYDLLHQVSGVLNMVGFPGAAFFAEETKELCRALIDNKVETFDSGLQILMQAILQMPSYLDIIQTEGHDIPIALLPIINEMRTCYNAVPLSEVELFSPKYHGATSPLTDEELQEINIEGVTNLLRKVRQSLQLSLIDLIHNRNLDIALDHLIKIFSYLARLCKATPISILWRVSLAFVTGISEKSITNTLKAKDLLKNIDRQMKLLVEEGVSGMNHPAPESLIKNLLFLLAQTDSQTQEILSVKQEFHLDNLILSADEVNTDQIKRVNDKLAVASVIEILNEEFVKIKDQLDLITRSESFANLDLDALLDILKNVSNTLEVLGLYSQKRIINQQLAIIDEAVSNNHFDKNQFMDIASAILDVETIIDGISTRNQNNKPSTGLIDSAQAAVIKEATNELTQVKDILSLYFDSEGKEGDISVIPELLGHTAGALNIISQQRAAAIVIRCLQYIEDHLINNPSFPNDLNLEAIVGAIASIDYYMECLAKNHLVSAKDATNFAIKYLRDLNYPLPEDYESLAVKYLKITEDTPVETAPSEPNTKNTSNKAVGTPSVSTEDQDFDEELIEIFTEEMGEILEALSTTLPAWVADTDDKESLQEVRRSFHTIKGSGRMVKATVIGELGWAIENMLNRVIDKTIPASNDVLDSVQNTVKLLPELVTEFSTHQQRERADVDYCAAVANALANKEEIPKKPDNGLDTLDTVIGQETITELVKNNADVYEEQEEVEQETSESEVFDTELINIFIAESKTHLQILKAFLTQCEYSLPQPVTDELQRAMHTLKGSAAMAGLDNIVNIAKPFEYFLKECNINNWLIQRIDLDLLQNAYSLLDQGICQLEHQSIATIEGADLLVERINARRSHLLAELESSMETQEETDDKAILINLLLQDVDLLLDAEDYIREWQGASEQTFTNQSELYTELEKIAKKAGQASIKPIAELCDALLQCYNAISVNRITKDETLINALLDAHSALLTSIDQLAAAQIVTDHPDIIERLTSLATIDTEKETSPIINEIDSTAISSTNELSIEESPVVEAPQLIPEVTTTDSDPVLVSEDKSISETQATTDLAVEMDNIDPDMVEIFLEEADEIVVAAKQNLDNWIINQKPDYLNSLQRQLHTLKGGARMCGVRSLGDLAHGLEFVYEGLLNGRYEYSVDLARLLTASHDYIQLIIDDLHDNLPIAFNTKLFDAIQAFRRDGNIVFNEAADIATNAQLAEKPTATTSKETSASPNLEQATPTTPEVSQLVNTNKQHTTTTTPVDNRPLAPVISLDKKVTNLDLKPTPTVKKEIQATKPQKEVKEQIKVSSELLDNLVNLAGETSIYRSRVEQQNSDLITALVEMDSTIDRVRDQLRRLDMETQAQIISKHQIEKTTSYLDFDPLEMDQYSQLQQLSRSLFESASDLQDLKETLMRRSSDVEALLQQQGRVNTELQEGLMYTRMVPLERIAPRLRRLIRQVSTELGKEAELVIGNTAGEMDRGVIDAIVAPLEHMIRNSLDHGIETKEDRAKAGKPIKGTILLDLVREGGEMVLRLTDDGAGIPVQAIREKAIAKGLMEADEDLSDNEVLQFILEAGFSTAKKVTQISGRGVGLDVVVNAVKQLGGVLSLESEEGKGTIFSIRLPINLSVSRALMIRVGDDSYAIPMSTVEGVSYLSHEQFKEFQKLGVSELEYGNESYRIKYLGELLGHHSEMAKETVGLGDKYPVLLVRSGDYHVALQVDELLPSTEIVVKSLGVQFLSVPAISGATILGDGRVVIILDLSALVRTYYVDQQNIERMEERRAAVEDQVASINRPPLVMVVDDSVTVRKVTTRLLERQGMQVITARDGLDAITQLEEKVPDIMLLDIEMPRMDGFEVASRVRHGDKTKHLPIIMITSRSGEKHRERALAIGVNEYMSKPFMDAKLIKSISDLLPSFEVNLLENN